MCRTLGLPEAEEEVPPAPQQGVFIICLIVGTIIIFFNKWLPKLYALFLVS